MLRCLFQLGRTLCGVVHICFLAVKSGTQRRNIFLEAASEGRILEMWSQTIVQPQLSCSFACTDTRQIENSSILKLTSFGVFFEAKKCSVAGPQVVARGLPLVRKLRPTFNPLHPFARFR